MTEWPPHDGFAGQTVTFKYTRDEYLEGMIAAYNRCLGVNFAVVMGLVGAVIEGVLEYRRGQVGAELSFSIVMHATLWAVIAWLFVRGFSRVAWWLYLRKPEGERTVELRRDGSDLWIDGLGQEHQVSDRDIFATLTRVVLVRLPSRAVHFVPTHALRTVSEGSESETQ